jgi:hypothetical protein
MTEREEFDRIVEGLDLDLSFADEPVAEPPVAVPQPAAPRVEPAEDEQFYRLVDNRPIVPRRRGILLAWAGVIGAPMLLVLATVAHVFLDRPIVAGAALIFVASAIYLFLQLPEHGPSRRDWPDDGAVL